ncbi:hypothetical protein [Pseudonocardia acaciae]|uniref:hypothetical protein n=1 Tax=Pseudonocardia acaciae TaxID=551276 RepID=UPI00048CDD06|nr:hypothetical protein [Pseudonocardia acaciae]
MGRDVEHLVQKALGKWEKARAMGERGNLAFAGVLYTRAIGRFVSYFQLTPHANVVPAYHALASMGCEAAMMFDHRGDGELAIQFARAGLAASHLADPAKGEPARIRNALRDEATRPMHQYVLTDARPPLRPATLIGGAAQARALLAGILRKYPGLPEPTSPRWPIGSGGRVSYLQDQKRYLRAVLPSCVGLDNDAEMRTLATEAVLIYDELCQSEGGFESASRRAVATLARIDGLAGDE